VAAAAAAAALLAPGVTVHAMRNGCDNGCDGEYCRRRAAVGNEEEEDAVSLCWEAKPDPVRKWGGGGEGWKEGAGVGWSGEG